MPEVKTAPVLMKGMTCFHKDHTLADIVRWIMGNRSEAEEIHRMLGEELARSATHSAMTAIHRPDHPTGTQGNERAGDKQLDT
jgi:hypothetical protein